MVPMRTLITAFSSAAKAALVQQGWQKRSGNVYTLDLNDGFLAWLGLNRASKHRPLTINPVVGVVHEPSRKLEQRLRGSESSIVPAPSERVPYRESPVQTSNDGQDRSSCRICATWTRAVVAGVLSGVQELGPGTSRR